MRLAPTCVLAGAAVVAMDCWRVDAMATLAFAASGKTRIYGGTLEPAMRGRRRRAGGNSGAMPLGVQPAGQLGSAGYSELVVDAAEMSLDRLDRQMQRVGDVLVA